MLEGKGDGTFLFRPHSKDGDFILSVVFRGKPTHHLLKRTDAGDFELNNKPTDGAKSLEEVRHTIFQSSEHGSGRLPSIWRPNTLAGPWSSRTVSSTMLAAQQLPQHLRLNCSCNNILILSEQAKKSVDAEKEHAAQVAAEAKSEADREAAEAERKKAAEEARQAAEEEKKRRILVEGKEAVEAEKAKETAREMVQALKKQKDAAKTAVWKWGGKARSRRCLYLHPTMSKAEADGLLQGKPDGTFLFRQRDAEGQFILSVVYRTKPTHHLVAQTDKDSPFMVNKKAVPEDPTTLSAV